LIFLYSQTVSEWRNHHLGFQAALNSRRQELWDGMADTLRGLLPKALEVLERALEQVLATVTVVDARHWFAHCGYPIQ